MLVSPFVSVRRCHSERQEVSWACCVCGVMIDNDTLRRALFVSINHDHKQPCIVYMYVCVSVCVCMYVGMSVCVLLYYLFLRHGYSIIAYYKWL